MNIRSVEAPNTADPAPVPPFGDSSRQKGGLGCASGSIASSYWPRQLWHYTYAGRERMILFDNQIKLYRKNMNGTGSCGSVPTRSMRGQLPLSGVRHYVRPWHNVCVSSYQASTSLTPCLGTKARFPVTSVEGWRPKGAVAMLGRWNGMRCRTRYPQRNVICSVGRGGEWVPADKAAVMQLSAVTVVGNGKVGFSFDSALDPGGAKRFMEMVLGGAR